MFMIVGSDDHKTDDDDDVGWSSPRRMLLIRPDRLTCMIS